MQSISSTLPGESYGRIIWAPTLTNHDPNPPLTIENGGGLNDTVVETVTATDTQTATVAFVSSITETVTATDVQFSGNVFSDTVVETVTASDSSTGTTPGNFSDSVTESVSATDSCDATVITPPIPPPPPAPLPGPLYGLQEIGVSGATSELAAQGTSSTASNLNGIGVAGSKDSIHQVKGPLD